MMQEQRRGSWLRRATATLAVGSLAVLLGAGPPQIPEAELRPLYSKDEYAKAMLELGMRMGAAVVEVERGNVARAKQALKEFRSYYQTVAGMVPSWKSMFPTGALDDLERANDPKQSAEKRTMAVKAVEAVCTDCHVQNMFPVQAQFRWGDFSAVSVEVDKKTILTFHEIMIDLANGLGAIRNDVSASNFDAAKQEFERVKERFNLMEDACTQCHEQPREYFIDKRVKGKLLNLGGLLRRGSKDAGRYETLLNEINQTSCFPCHRVHMPAAYLQHHWQSKSGK